MLSRIAVNSHVIMRRFLKALAFILAGAVVSPLIALSWLEQRLWQGEALFGGFAQLLALMPSIVGVYLRGAYYLGTLSEASWETHVGFGSVFTHRGAALGTRASMGAYCVLGHAKIGASVMMGSHVSIPSGKRQHFAADGGIAGNPRYTTVIVGERTWVGESAVILADVGKDCIVAAGAVVTASVPDRVLIAGNPARIVRELSH